MKNVKINRNKQQPSSEEIKARKDFGSVLKQHKAGATSSGAAGKGLFKSVWLNAVIVAVTAVAAVVIYMAVSENKPVVKEDKPVVKEKAKQIAVAGQDKTYVPENKNDMLQTAFVQPPIKGVDVPFDNYKVSTSKETVINYRTGSKLTIPKGCFVDAKGNAVKGEVDIRYREFHDPVDFFVSGIPMTYDSAGTQYHFESAGMLEVYAFKDGQVLKMDLNKPIQVELSTNDKSGKFNLYKLDTAARNWEYKGKDKVITNTVGQTQPQGQNVEAFDFLESDTVSLLQPQADPKIKEITQKITVVKEAIVKLAQQKPTAPQKANKQKFQFNIDVDVKEFPELAIYKGALFQVGDENNNFSEKFYNVTWDNAVITEGKKGVNYILTLTKGRETHKLTVYPVFDGANYEKAKAEYQAKFTQYQSKLDDRKAEEKQLQAAYEARVKQIEADQKAQLEKWEKENAKRVETMNTQQKVFRAFTISSFGVWNSDCPQRLPKGNEVAASFKDNNGNDLTFYDVYLVEKNKNAMFIYHPDKFKSLSYDPRSKNMMWGVTAENKLALFSYNDFAKMPSKKGAYTFNMTIAPKEFKSIAEIKDYLDI